MKTEVTKHAKGLYLISFEVEGHELQDSDWLPISNLYDLCEYIDLKKILLMDKSGIFTVKITLKANYENFELAIAILEDKKYYDLTEMKGVLNLMENI